MRVSADNNVLDAQPRHGKFDGGRLSRRVDAVRWDNVAGISQNEQIPGQRMGQAVGIDPRVGKVINRVSGFWPWTSS